MAEVAAFCLLLASERRLFACLENPAGSMIFNYDPIKMVLEWLLRQLRGLFRVVTPYCAFSQLPLGARYFKPFKFVAISPLNDYNWIGGLKRVCSCGDFGHVRLMPDNKRGKPSGNPQHLVASQGYPPALGEALVSEWLKADAKLVASNANPGVFTSSSSSGSVGHGHVWEGALQDMAEEQLREEEESTSAENMWEDALRKQAVLNTTAGIDALKTDDGSPMPMCWQDRGTGSQYGGNANTGHNDADNDVVATNLQKREIKTQTRSQKKRKVRKTGDDTELNWCDRTASAGC